MPWIENIGLKEVKQGFHHDAGPNSMLIQIVDPGMEFPTPKHAFKKTSQYFFLDVEDKNIPGAIFDAAITDADAKGIAEDLRYAFENSMNVVVHCHMGVSRSGAVAEVGTMIGFSDVGKFRVPNLLVKHKLMRELNLMSY